MAISRNATLIPGDIVLIPLAVKFTVDAGEAQIAVQAEEYGPTLYIDRSKAELVSTKIGIGDEVCFSEAAIGLRGMDVNPGIVAAIVGDKAWIACPGNEDSVQYLRYLHRVRTRAEVAEGAMRPSERDAAEAGLPEHEQAAA